MHALCFEVEQLATDHPSAARCSHEVAHDTCHLLVRQSERPGRVRCTAGGKWNHRETRCRGNRNTIDAVHRRATAPHIVVVHAWQVVMHERVRMYYLDRSREFTRVALPTAGPVRLEQQNRPQALTLAEQSISDGFRRQRRDVGEPTHTERVERLLHRSTLGREGRRAERGHARRGAEFRGRHRIVRGRVPKRRRCRRRLPSVPARAHRAA